jgi:flagellar basal body-associated protein FliL
MRPSVSNEESRVNKKNKHRLLWIISGIIIVVFAAAAFGIPFGINLARNGDATTTTTAVTSTIATAATSTVTTTSGKQ